MACKKCKCVTCKHSIEWYNGEIDDYCYYCKKNVNCCVCMDEIEILYEKEKIPYEKK